LKTAYWFYVAPNGLQKSSIPTIEQMETELANYVNKNLVKCIENFTLFEMYNITIEKISTEAKIKKEGVIFTVDLPVHIDVNGFSFTIPRFYTEVNAGLGKLYEIAKEIMDKENEDFFLEEKTIDILAVYSDIPFSETDFACSPKIWTKSNVAEALKRALETNIQFIKIKGTAFEPRERYFMWDALKKRYKDVSASFRYSSKWPLKMDVYPSEGEVLKAEPMTNIGNEAMAYLVSLFCITDYHFVYDIQYPVLVTLTDKGGYTLQFATIVVIDNNQPRENLLGTMELPEPERKICSNKVAPATIYALAPDREGNLVPVENAEIKLKCASTTCNIGSTKQTGTEARLDTELPQCVNALLTAEKEGYHTGREIVSTVSGGAYSVLLEPYKKLDYEIKVVENGAERQLEEDEIALVSIENKEKGFSILLSSPTGELNLISGKFNLKSTLITKGFEINIKGKEVTHCFKVPTKNVFGLLGFEEEKCTTAKSEDTTLDQVVRGGSETEWEVGRELATAKKVTFYIPAGKIPSNIDELEEAYASIEDPTKAIKPLLE